MPDRYQNGVVTRLVSDLRVGDRVNLENDPIADPEGAAGEATTYHPEFAFEFATVAEIEIESPECTRVDFDNFSCGFPPDHWLEVDPEQVREVAS